MAMTTTSVQEQAESLLSDLEAQLPRCSRVERRQIQELRLKVEEHDPLTLYELREYQELLESLE